MGTPLSRASGPTVRIRVAIVGGGPAGLITAINLIEWAISCGVQDRLHVTVFDQRYREQISPQRRVVYEGSRCISAPALKRRCQVVTLQQDCIQFLRTSMKVFGHVAVKGLAVATFQSWRLRTG